MWRNGQITMFLHGHMPAHGDTDYNQWAEADAPYELGVTNNGCAPCILTQAR